MALNWDRLKDVCTSIKAVVISQKERLTIEQLRKDYRNIEGEDIPYLELGFKSVRSLLESIPEHVRLVTYNGIEYVIQVDNERTKQISQFVAGQKTATKNNNKKFRGCRPNIGYSYQQRHPTLVNQHRTNLDREDLAFIINQVNRYPNGLTRNQIIDFLHQRDRFLKLPGHTLDHYLGQLAQNHKICLKDSLILPIIEDRPSSVPFVRQQVANNYTNSMTRNNSSLTERRNILPAECMLDDPDEVEEMFDDQEEEKACAKMNGKHTEEPISDRIKFRVLKLVEEHEDGIWCAELPKLYEAKYKIGLDYTEFGFGSVAEFVDHLQNYTLKQPKPRGDFKIYLKKPHENGNISQNQKQSTASLYNVYDPSYENKQAVPKTLKTDSKKRMIPEDVLSFDETVGQESVLELNDGDDVVVCEVFDPSFFWVKKVDQINPLKKLMYELGEFYKEKFKSYSIPPIILQNGLNVACKYQNMWHRAVILSVRTDGLVTILFYDYGTINLRDPNELCFLHRKFSTLPAIAIPCGLYNMMPALGNRWLRHAVIEFTDMCYDKPSKIEVKSIDKDTNSAMVHLCTGRMYVHQKMIEKQLAVEGNVITKVDMENLEQYSEHYLKSRQLAGPIITALVQNRPQSYAENNLLISPQRTIECFPQPDKIPTILKEEIQPLENTNCKEEITKITTNDVVCDYLKLIFQQNAMILDRLKIADKKDGMLPKPLIDHMKSAYATNMKLIELRSTWDSDIFESEVKVNGHSTDTDESTSADDNRGSNNPFKDSKMNGNVSSTPPPSPTNNDTILKAQAYFFNGIQANGTLHEKQTNGFHESNGIHDENDDEVQIEVEDDSKLKPLEKSKIPTPKKGSKIVQDLSSTVIEVALNTVIDGNVHAIVIDNECWLITAEFCGAFLNQTLDAFNISIQEKQFKLNRRIIRRVDHPTIFKQLARNKDIDESMIKTEALDLISTKSAMLVLVKYGTINLKGLKAADLVSKATITRNEKAPCLDQFQEMVLKDFLAITKAYINFTEAKLVSEIEVSH